MTIRNIKKNISSTKLNSITQEFQESNKIPRSIYQSVEKSSPFRTLNYTSQETDDYILVTPTITSQIVEDYAKKCNYDAVISLNRESFWYISKSSTSEFDWLPEIRQSFHEGDYSERKSNYKYVFHEENSTETEIAVPAPNPIQRLNTNITFTHCTQIGGLFPRKWILKSKENNLYELRERSGSIRLYRVDDKDENDKGEIFNAYIGREHPGTSLKDNEILNIITSLEFFSMSQNTEEVPEEDINKVMRRKT